MWTHTCLSNECIHTWRNYFSSDVENRPFFHQNLSEIIAENDKKLSFPQLYKLQLKNVGH